MRKNEDKRGKEKSTAKNLLFGTVIGFLIILLVFAVCAALISNEKIGQGTAEQIILIASFVGSFVGGMAAAVKNGARKALVGLGVGGIITAVKLLISAFGMCDVLSLTTAVFIVCTLGGGFCGGMLTGRKKKKRRS